MCLVVVVDNNPPWAKRIQRAVQEAAGGNKLEVIIAENGEEALEVIAKNPDKALAVITNFDMGPGMNGGELAEQITALRSNQNTLIALRTIEIGPEVVNEHFSIIRRKGNTIEEVREFALLITTAIATRFVTA